MLYAGSRSETLLRAGLEMARSNGERNVRIYNVVRVVEDLTRLNFIKIGMRVDLHLLRVE